MSVLSFPFPRVPAQGRSPAQPARSRFRPLVPVTLIRGNRAEMVYALIDSGSDQTIFNHEIGGILGIRVEQGIKGSFTGTSGTRQDVFYHQLGLKLRSGFRSAEYTARVGFARLPSDVAGILGQKGFFDHFEVLLSQRKELIILRQVTRTVTS